MINNITKEKKLAVIFAFLHVLATFYSDKTFFVDFKNHLPIVICLKILLFIILCFAWHALFCLFFKSNDKIYRIAVYSIPCFFFLLIYVFRSHPMQLVGDEYNIYAQAIVYNIFPYQFTYITGILYIMSFMLLPFQMGVVLIKLVVQALVCGYCVYRFTNAFGKKGAWIYLLFYLNPVVYNGMQAHRMQFYALLYLFVIVKLFFDFYEHKHADFDDLAVCILSFALLAMWRKEGIYLAVAAPILLCITYYVKGSVNVVKVTACFLSVFLLIYTPELLSGKEFAYESEHTYITWFVHMCREGLKQEDYPEEFAEIDRYVSIDAVNYINEQLGDDNYQDNYIAWREGYIGIRENATEDDYYAMTAAVKSLVRQEPIIFLKTRIGIWFYGAGSLSFDSIRSALISMENNLNIPMLALIIGCLYGLIFRNWMVFFTAGMLIANALITTFASPAAYFKYYYHQYLVGWVYIIIFVLLWSSTLNLKHR